MHCPRRRTINGTWWYEILVRLRGHHQAVWMAQFPLDAPYFLITLWCVCADEGKWYG